MTDQTSAGTGGMSHQMDRRLRSQLGQLQVEARSLRTRVRWLTGGLVLALVAVVLVALRPDLLAMDDGSGGLLETRHLVLVGEDGQARGEWRVDEEGNVRLTMMDRQRSDRLSISVLSGGYPGLSLIDAQGQRRAALGLLPDETTSLVFADASGVARAVLGLTGADAANLVFADARGVSRIGLGLDATGMGSVMLPDSVEADEMDPGLP